MLRAVSESLSWSSCRFEAGGFKFEGTPLEHQVLPEEWLRDWTRNLTTILSYLKVTSSLIFT